MSAVERQFSLHGLKLAALEWPGEGLPLIALHGWLDNAASFLPLAPHLEGVKLLAPDLVGHGHSDHLPAAAAYHLSDTCRWVAALADAMGWERFALLGHSMGAAAASITAAAMPQRVAALVLVDGLAPLAFTPEREIARLQELFAPSPLRQRLRRPISDLELAVRLRRRLGRFPLSAEAARLLAARGVRAVEGGYHWSHDERLQGPSTHYYCAEQAEGVLRAIQAPTLLLSGEQGALAGWEELEQRKRCISRLQHVVLPGGHHLHMEDPVAVAEVVNRFLAVAMGEEA